MVLRVLELPFNVGLILNEQRKECLMPMGLISGGASARATSTLGC